MQESTEAHRRTRGERTRVGAWRCRGRTACCCTPWRASTATPYPSSASPSPGCTIGPRCCTTSPRGARREAARCRSRRRRPQRRGRAPRSGAGPSRCHSLGRRPEAVEKAIRRARARVAKQGSCALRGVCWAVKHWTTRCGERGRRTCFVGGCFGQGNVLSKCSTNAPGLLFL